MPIVKFSGIEAGPKVIAEMIQQIKLWVSSVKELEIGPEHVRPIFVPTIQENQGECVIFEIPELFTKSFKGTARTPSMKKDLCKAIKEGFNGFALEKKLSTQKAVTIIHMVDREQGEFDHWDLPPSEKKSLNPHQLGRWQWLQ